MSSLERRGTDTMFRPRTYVAIGAIGGIAGALILPGLIAGAVGFIALAALVIGVYMIARLFHA